MFVVQYYNKDEFLLLEQSLQVGFLQGSWVITNESIHAYLYYFDMI